MEGHDSPPNGKETAATSPPPSASADDPRAELQQLRHDLRSLQNHVLNLRQNIHPLVFIHLAKTGGSSIWHALIQTAAVAKPPLPIIDLYHQGRCHFHSVTDVYQVLEQFKENLPHQRAVIHHHTSHPIGIYFEPPPLYTTIVRDPVDRFISDLNHTSAVLRGEWDEVHEAKLIDPKVEVEGRGWSRELVEMASASEVPFEELVDFALRESCLSRYYYWTFFNLLLGQPVAVQPPLAPHGMPSNEALANLVRAKFAYIGRFPHVFKTYFKIARLYKIPSSLTAENFPHVLQRNSQQLIPERRKELRIAFAEEYDFLARLGFDFA